MSGENDNMSLVRRYIEDLYSDGRLDNPKDNYFAGEITVHDASQPQPLRGDPDQFVRVAEQLLNAFTIMESRIVNLFGSDDKVVGHWAIRGKHTGFLFGLPPTNRVAVLEGIAIFRLENNKIVEMWGVTDSLETLQELELLPQIGIRTPATA